MMQSDLQTSDQTGSVAPFATAGDAAPGVRPKGALTVTSAAGLLAAFLASVCCIGPLVFAALGVGVGATGFLAGTASFLKALLPYRPVFIGLTACLLGLAFYVACWKSEASCAPGMPCGAVSGRRANRALLWIVTALAMGLVLAPYWLPLL